MDIKECINLPPVELSYENPKGSHEEIAGLKTYVVGDAKSKRAIVVVYDIHGFSSQMVQTADLLADAVGARVYIPDFFKGQEFPGDKYKPNSPERAEAFAKFLQTAAAIRPALEALSKIVSAIRSTDVAPHVGGIGFCWGGKVLVLAGGEEDTANKDKASGLDGIVMVHPGRLDPADAAALKIPVAFFPSKDEPSEAVEKFQENVTKLPFAGECVSKIYSNMFHGWAGARANLKDEDNLREYKDVLSRAAAFLQARV